MTTFTVDTHLFRELGELLVGRDSTALIELIKNSYDADASEVVVYGEALTQPSRGLIRIRDNGIGMSRDEFERGFLRIASRSKETSSRRSAVYKRRYTGAKGIGRLAAHKLARHLRIESVRWDQSNVLASGELRANLRGIEATIDWDSIEAKDTLDQLESTNAIVITPTNVGSTARAGTTITLSRLRRKWTSAEHGRFLEEIQAYAPPAPLIGGIPRSVLREELLFKEPVVRDITDKKGNKFTVVLDGELAAPDDYWTAILEASNWIIEIDASKATGKVRYAIAPTEKTLEDLPDIATRRFEISHPSPSEGPFFHARIWKRTGARFGELKRVSDRSSGVRVYMEGFRILPYGEPGNDWLNLDRDANERDRNFFKRESNQELLKQFPSTEADSEVGLGIVPNKHYAGGVFLTETRAPSLQMLVNREGFVPDADYDTLVALVRRGLDLQTRVQAAATSGKRAERRETRATARETSSYSAGIVPVAASVQAAMRDARTLTQTAKRLVANGKIEAANKQVELALRRVEAITETPDDLIQENAMIRVLASVGTQLASFVHEINGLLSIASSVDKSLSAVRDTPGLSARHKQDLGKLQKSVGDLRRSLERQASFLIDIVAPDARRRRSRQYLAKRFDAAAKLISFASERDQIKLINNIPTDLQSPPMFPAEVVAIFSNLLTNAVKAAGSKGRIKATGKHEKDGSSTVRVENSGVRVSLRTSERWFRPFESSTTAVDPVLGQGMGLGLPITRNMLEEYGATIRFVEPSGGFSTAIEIRFPSGRP
ncbi:signal transduction histidine kinase [Bradyrhizobium sp. USDA 4449]